VRKIIWIRVLDPSNDGRKQSAIWQLILAGVCACVLQGWFHGWWSTGSECVKESEWENEREGGREVRQDKGNYFRKGLHIGQPAARIVLELKTPKKTQTLHYKQWIWIHLKCLAHCSEVQSDSHSVEQALNSFFPSHSKSTQLQPLCFVLLSELIYKLQIYTTYYGLNWEWLFKCTASNCWIWIGAANRIQNASLNLMG